MNVRHMRMLCLLAALTCAAAAQEITGTVINLTTNRPSAGDNVVLMKLQQGMDEVATTKTDAQGRFTFKIEEPTVAHLIRVSHRNVNYFRSAPPGTTSVEINVYDAAEDVDGVKQTLDIIRMEGDVTNLRVIEMYAVENNSKPPRTLMRMKSFEIQLPKGAKLDQAMAAGPNSMPVTASPVPQGNDRYAFLFPIRPGETRFQIAYTMPYSGSAELKPALLQPVGSFAVSVPPGMTIEPAAGSTLRAAGEDGGLTVFVAQNAQPGQDLSFKVSGRGTLPDPDAQTQAAGGGDGERGPGGGIGAPVNTPDPLYKYRWWIVAGVALLLAAGAGFTLKAQPQAAAASAAGAPKTGLDALKDEMFHLESERVQGKISDEEYAKAKAALDVLMKRALERKG